MLSALLLAALAAVLAGSDAPETPDGIYRRAAVDMSRNVPVGKRRVTRYLALNGVPEGERAKFLQSLDFTLNSVSFRSQIYHPPTIGDDRLLVRLDLEALGWDRESRAARQARLKLSGVDFKLKGEDQRLFEDAWESFAQADVYWKADQIVKGQHIRGWIDPSLDRWMRYYTGSQSAVLSAHWLMPRLLVEKAQGGFYSQVLMLPNNERDLYRAFGVDEKLVDRDFQLKVGGGTLESVVAIHNRHLQLIPSLYGYDERFMWRTADFKDEGSADKDIFDRPAGNLKHDGREIIGTLPNGIHFYYLADGKGKQVAVVPQDIAIDKRPDPFGKIKDRSVINAYKCVDCHDRGINPFVDVERAAILNPDIALLVKSKDKRKLAEITQSFEDYYMLAEKGGIESKIVRQNESYARRVFAVNDLTPEDNSERVVGYFNKYTWDLVSPEQAAAEMGLAREAARIAWRHSGDSQLVVLSTGQAIRRASWENSFAAAMRAQTYRWEKVLVPVRIIPKTRVKKAA